MTGCFRISAEPVSGCYFEDYTREFHLVGVSEHSTSAPPNIPSLAANMGRELYLRAPGRRRVLSSLSSSLDSGSSLVREDASPRSPRPDCAVPCSSGRWSGLCCGERFRLKNKGNMGRACCTVYAVLGKWGSDSARSNASTRTTSSSFNGQSRQQHNGTSPRRRRGGEDATEESRTLEPAWMGLSSPSYTCSLAALGARETSEP
jgi:hypothetical protein